MAKKTPPRRHQRLASLIARRALVTVGARAGRLTGARALSDVVPEYSAAGQVLVYQALCDEFHGIRVPRALLRNSTTLVSLVGNLSMLIGPHVYKCANNHLTTQYGDGTCRRDGLALKAVR